MGSKYASLYIQGFNLPSAVLGRKVCNTKRYFCHVGGLINFTLTLLIRGNNLVVNI